MMSPELFNSRGRVNGTSQEKQQLNLTNKNSYTHVSHQAALEQTRRSDNYQPASKSKVTTSKGSVENVQMKMKKSQPTLTSDIVPSTSMTNANVTGTQFNNFAPPPHQFTPHQTSGSTKSNKNLSGNPNNPNA